jgi:hypothetical protein
MLLQQVVPNITYEDTLAEAGEYSTAEGGLDPEAVNRKCPNNRVCTSLVVVEKIAQKAGKKYGFKVDAGEGWTIEKVQDYVSRDVPVMVNYGGGRSGGIGHSVVIVGYDFNESNPNESVVYYLNPSTGNQTPQKSKWEGTDRSFNKNTWSDSDYNDPTQPSGYSYYRWALAVYED